MAAVEAADMTDGTLSHEDHVRAQLYHLLALLLVRPADKKTLAAVSALAGDDSDLGRDLEALARSAAAADAETLSEEYHDLFIGLGRGELVPFGSFYLTGFLHEKPLAKLRQDMMRLGIARADAVKEPEDHIGFLCDMMAGLIEGHFGASDLAVQKSFFETHLDPWAERFFEDLEGAKAASFYRSVGAIGQRFMTIERTAFQMI